MPAKLQIEKGEKYGKLTVVREGMRRSSGRYFIFDCDCGNRVELHLGKVRIGNTKSCGCYQKANPSRKTHGMSKTHFYKVWCDMKARCYNKNDCSYPFYGGRGIKVCSRWRNRFESFKDDMYPSYLDFKKNNKGLTPSIDRIDANSDYKKTNCQWLTISANHSKQRKNNYITFNGHTLNISQWAKLLGMERKTIEYRLRKGYPVEVALGSGKLSNSGSRRVQDDKRVNHI